MLLAGLAAAYTPSVNTVLDSASCVSVASSASDAWCVSNCGAGNCPPTLCKCGDEAKAAKDTAAATNAAALPEAPAVPAVPDVPGVPEEPAWPPMTKHELGILKAVAKTVSLKNLNKWYEEGKASNNVSKAGLLVHQHDNTEKGWGEDAYIYNPGGKPFFATTMTNKHLKGLYNDECGIIVTPSASSLMCSYYADFMSWDAGCERKGLNAANGWHTAQQPSVPRGTPYPPEEFKEMMEMSQELQDGKGRPPAAGELGYNAAAAKKFQNLARKGAKVSETAFGNGEPGGAEFWLGGYNEVLISRVFYESGLPWSVAAAFFVDGGDGGGPACVQKTHASLTKWYGKNASHVLMVKLKPGKSPAFEEYVPPTPS